MNYLFTTTDKTGSRLIRWGTQSNVSHMVQAFGFMNHSPCIESRLFSGVYETIYEDITERNQILYIVEYNGEIELGEQQQIFRNARKKIGSAYDIKGMLFFAFAIIYWVKILGSRLPMINKWADHNDYFCSELLFANEEFLKDKIDLNRYSKQMMSPDRALELFRDSPYFTVREYRA